jgi:radical SAM protein with 4Fe4S-binding SPASM domain
MTSLDKNHLLTTSKTFCMMPFMHMYLNTDGNVLPCCTAQYNLPMGNVREQPIKVVWNSEEYKELRRKIINDEPVESCKNCYLHDKESGGTNSFRQWANRDFAEHVDIVDYMQPDGYMTEMPLKYFDVRFSNICNYKCRTCGDLFSTSWAQEDNKFRKDKKPITIHVSNGDPNLLEQFKPYLPEMACVYFAGGEPLITPEHYEILEFLIEQKSTKMLLRYNSNMSVLSYKDKNVIDLWNQFEKVDLYASIDSWGTRAEYIRHGTVWPEVVENLKRIKREAPHVSIQFNSVISLFNVLTVTDFLDAMEAEGLYDPFESRPTLYRAITPPELSMRVLDPETKQLAKDKINNWLAKFPKSPSKVDYALKDIVSYLDEDHSHLQAKAKWHIDTFDYRRNESFVATFPELKEWYERIRTN